MIRARHILTLASLVMGGLAAAAPAGADRPIRGSAGGGFTNPCSGDLVIFDVPVIVGGNDNFVFAEQGVGTGIDTATGETFTVIFSLQAVTATPDETGSFTGHVVLVFVGGQETFTVVSVANLNAHTGEIKFAGFESFVCGGSGPA
jgi:hypothetical protein